MEQRHIFSLSYLKLIIVALIATNALASDATQGFSSSLSLGRLSGEAHEYVYIPSSNRKLSQLDWKIKSAYVLKGDLSWRASSLLALNAKGWITIEQGRGYMDDYDWLDAHNPHKRTHHSWHSDTPLNYASEIDMNARFVFLHKGQNRMSGVLGYQRDKYSWESRSGHYRYTDNFGNIISGTFPNEKKVISYTQTYSMPYIGLAFEHTMKKGALRTEVKYSKWVRAEDVDEHYLRELTFYEKADSAKFVGFSITFLHKLDKNLTLLGEYSMNHYKHTIADTTMFNKRQGSVTFYKSGAGLSNKTQLLMLGLEYRF